MLFRERRRKTEEDTKRETERETLVLERNIDWLPLTSARTGDGTHSPGMCPDQGLNLQPWHIGMTLSPTELPRQGEAKIFLTNLQIVVFVVKSVV